MMWKTQVRAEKDARLAQLEADAREQSEKLASLFDDLNREFEAAIQSRQTKEAKPK